MGIELRNLHNGLHVRGSFRVFEHRFKILTPTPLSVVRNPYIVCTLMNVSRYEAGQIPHRLLRSFNQHIHQSLLVLWLDGEDIYERDNIIFFRDYGHQISFQSIKDTHESRPTSELTRRRDFIQPSPHL